MKRPDLKALWRDTDRRYSLLKLLTLIALVVYTTLVLTAGTTRDADLNAVAVIYDGDPELSQLMRGDANMFRKRLGIDPDGIDQWLVYGSDDQMNVSELIVIKCADTDTRERALEAVTAHRGSLMDAFRDYGTNQYDLLERSILWEKGNYIFFGVSENAEDWERTLLSRIQ